MGNMRKKNKDNSWCIPKHCLTPGRAAWRGTNESYRCKVRFVLTILFSLVFGIYQILGKLVNITSEQLLKILSLNLTYPDQEEQVEMIKIMETIDKENDNVHHKVTKKDIKKKERSLQA